MILIRLVLLLISLFLIISPLLYLYASKEAFSSFVTAYISSSLILLASFKSYKSMVEKRLLVSSKDEFDLKDTISKLEDPYNLYDEDEEIDEDLSPKELIKREKKLLKKNKRGFIPFLKDSAMAFNLLRVFAYLLFVFGFFYLLNSKLLSIPFYLATIIIPNIIVVVYLQIVNR